MKTLFYSLLKKYAGRLKDIDIQHELLKGLKSELANYNVRKKCWQDGPVKRKKKETGDDIPENYQNDEEQHGIV